jgi:hypothetical protein
LNPVSVNDADQLAVRVRLADSRKLILRVDPVAAERHAAHVDALRARLKG